MQKNDFEDKQYDGVLEKIFFLLFTLYIASVIIFARPDNVLISNLVNVLLIGYFFFYQLISPSKIYYFNAPLLSYLLFVIFTVLSITWTVDLAYSNYMVMRLLQIFINLFIVYNIVKIYKFHEAFFIGMMIGTLFNFLLAIGVIKVGFPIYFGTTERFMGTTINPNITGGMIMFSLMGSILFLQYVKDRVWIILNMLNIMFSFYIIFMTASRAALIVASGIMSIFIVQTLLDKKNRVYLLGFAFILLVATLIFIDIDKLLMQLEFVIKRIGFIIDALSGQAVEHSATERLAFIKIALNVFADHPFFGTGINTMRVFLHGVYAHNNYVELLGTVGLIGTLLYYGMHITLTIKVFLLKDFWMKVYLLTFILTILVYDLGGVTYYSKLTLVMILLLSYITEEKNSFKSK